MIDAENEIFTLVASALRERFPGITVYNETVLSPSSFPCVCIEEADNYAYVNTISSSSNENHAVVVYEVNVYSNKGSGKKAECKSIFASVDDAMQKIGFVRTASNPILLEGEATILRMFGRYTAVLSGNKTIYRR